VLDEATSHLDPVRERSVNGAIGRLKLTRIVIAHRLETIMAADRQAIVSQGKVRLSGPIASASTPTVRSGSPGS